MLLALGATDLVGHGRAIDFKATVFRESFSRYLYGLWGILKTTELWITMATWNCTCQHGSTLPQTLEHLATLSCAFCWCQASWTVRIYVHLRQQARFVTQLQDWCERVCWVLITESAQLHQYDEQSDHAAFMAKHFGMDRKKLENRT